MEVVARRLDDPNAVVVLEEALLRHMHHGDCTSGIINNAPAVHVRANKRCFAYFCKKFLCFSVLSLKIAKMVPLEMKL